MVEPTRIEAIVETAVYVDDPDADEASYRDVLGPEMMSREAGRHVFFRVGDGVLPVFAPDSTLKGDTFPPHGARGPGHFALGARAGRLRPGRRRHRRRQERPYRDRKSWQGYFQ
ncbi:hypothetical protein AB1L88_10795 [Tautonia sp. JC769]|uniref:hypothetical protein n=1 Tax=Tautonia sp. JC769 TaxID=3232135 RepID=UPI003459FD53